MRPPRLVAIRSHSGHIRQFWVDARLEHSRDESAPAPISCLNSTAKLPGLIRFFHGIVAPGPLLSGPARRGRLVLRGRVRELVHQVSQLFEFADGPYVAAVGVILGVGVIEQADRVEWLALVCSDTHPDEASAGLTPPFEVLYILYSDAVGMGS